jgi:hypothetical protein
MMRAQFTVLKLPVYVSDKFAFPYLCDAEGHVLAKCTSYVIAHKLAAALNERRTAP